MNKQFLRPKDSNNNLSTPYFEQEHSTTSLFSIISEAKPAEIIVNDCGEVELQMTRENHKYYMAYELIFQVNNRESLGYSSIACEASLVDPSKNQSDKLCCFAETKNSSLLLATDRGTIGIIDVSNSLTTWVSIMKPYYDDNSTPNPFDNLYDSGIKVLVDLCVDNKNDQIIVLTKFKIDSKVSEFKVELHSFDEAKNEMNLTRIFNLSQILSSHLNHHESFDFVRIYYDQSDNAFVLLDSNNHKLYWCNTFNFQAKRCIKSADGESIQYPSGVAMIDNPKTLYVCSQKGMLIRKQEHQPVKHDSLKPIDISYSCEERAIYFIDEFNLYRSKISDTVVTEQRFKRIFSNKCQNKRFRRVVACQNYVFIMSKEINSLFVIDRKSLKF